MAKFEHPYIQEVAELGFPNPERVMITHGSALVVRGVRLPHNGGDIDLVTDPENLLPVARKLGWAAVQQYKYYAEDLPEKIRYVVSPDGKYDIFTHDYIPELYRQTGRGRVYPDKLFELHDPRFDQDEDTGIWVASLPFVVATKTGTGRTKDAEDVRRVAQFQTDGY